MVDGLTRLRHHTVVGCDHQDDQVGGLGTTCAHGRESLVTRRIEKGHHAAVGFDVVGADVLGDAASLAAGDACAADVVEQRGLAVIDVTHDGDHRRAWLEGDILLVGARGLIEEGIRVVELRGKGFVTHFLDDDHRRFLVERLIDGHHRAHLHQRLDHFGGLDRHLVRQIGNGDRLGHIDLVDHRLHRQLERVFLLLTAGAASGTLAVLVVPPAGSTGGAARLQAGALVGTLVLPLAFLVGDLLLRQLLVGRLLVARRRLAGRLVQGLVFGGTLARGLCCHLLGNAGRLRRHCLVLGILLEARQIGGALLLALELGFLASAQFGVAPLFFSAQPLLLLADDRRPRHHFLAARLHVGDRFGTRFDRRRGDGFDNRFALHLDDRLGRRFDGRFGDRLHDRLDGHFADRLDMLDNRQRSRLLDDRRHRGGLRRPGRHFGTCVGNIALDENALLAHLDLHGMRLAVRVLRPDLGRFLARQGDLGLAVRPAMRASQIIQQLRLVLLGKQIVRLSSADAGLLQLFEQRASRHLELGRKLGNTCLRHMNSSFPLTRTSAHAPW